MTPVDLLTFWFGETDAVGCADAAHRKRWFDATPAFDDEVRVQFGDALEQALTGAWEPWTASPEGTLALIVLLDQMPRNIHRGTAQAWAGDRRALALAARLVANGADLHLHGHLRAFAYLPFEHAESRQAQATHIGLLTRWQVDVPPQFADHLAESLRFAHTHADIVQQFGRFPHRNAALGRTSTPAELAFLAGSGNRFGQ